MLGVGGDRAAAGRAASPGRSRSSFLLVRAIDDADVHARADRPSWLAARVPQPDRRRPVRSEAARAAARWSGSRARCRCRSGWRCCPMPRWPARSSRCAGCGTAARRARLPIYALTLGGGSALGFALFASYANQRAALRRADAGLAERRWSRRARCCSLLALAQPERRAVRLALAVAGGRGDRRRLRARLPAMPRPARTGLARARSATGWTMSARRSRSTSTRFRVAFPIADACRSSA